MKRTALYVFTVLTALSTILGLVTQVRKNLDRRELAAEHREPGSELRVWADRIEARWGRGPVAYVREPRPGEDPGQARYIAQYGLAPLLFSETEKGRVFLDFMSDAGARRYAAEHRLRVVEGEGGRALAVPVS